MKKDASLMIHTVNEQHILYYTVSKHLNTAYEDAELYEYGIKCALCDKRGKMMDVEDVKFSNMKVDKADEVPYFVLRDVENIEIENFRNVKDKVISVAKDKQIEK